MSKQIKMTFWRDDYSGPACLEYSWVPEGKRHLILLKPGEHQKAVPDTISDTLKPSHVQVYRLLNNGTAGPASTEEWQFPPGPPHATPILAARVEVFSKDREAIGAVYYEDGTTARDKRHLDPILRRCPEFLTDDKE